MAAVGDGQNAPIVKNGDVNVYPPFYRSAAQHGELPVYIRQGDIEYPFEDTTGGGNENKMRGNWPASYDFALAGVAFTVGLGNLWHFPYYCYWHGGAAFLIPFCTAMFVLVGPLALLECSVAQFCSLGCVALWKLCPLFKGIGVTMLAASCIMAVYTNMATAWSVYYLIASAGATLPWALCGERVLRVSNSIDEFGTIHWELALYLLVAWIIIFLCNFKGVESMGRVVYVSGTLPYLLLVVLLARVWEWPRAVTLPGGAAGLLKLAAPRWHQLWSVRTWGNAFVAAMGSLCLGWGGLHTLSSYCRFHANVARNVLFLCVACVLSACVAVATAFSALGALAEEAAVRPDKLLTYSVDQVFISWPELLARLQVAPLWSAVFFALVVTLALDTQMVLVHTAVTAVCDAFPERLRRNDRHVLACVCLIFYAAGVVLCSSAGVHVIAVLDYYVRTWTVLLVATGEVLTLGWIYGADNVLDNVKWICGAYPRPYIVWKVLWKWVVPVVLLALLTFVWYDYTPIRHAAATSKAYPYWADAIGWAVGLAPAILVPITALFQFIFVARGGCLKRIQDLLSPADDWGPALAVHRAEQYPLQMPEARPPIRRSQNRGAVYDDVDLLDEDGDVIYNDGIFDDRPQPDQPLMRSRAAVPEFDRETAI